MADRETLATMSGDEVSAKPEEESAGEIDFLAKSKELMRILEVATSGTPTDTAYDAERTTGELTMSADVESPLGLGNKLSTLISLVKSSNPKLMVDKTYGWCGRGRVRIIFPRSMLPCPHGVV